MRRINYLNLAAVFGVSTMLLWSGCSSDSNNSDTPPATSIEYIDYNGETRTAAATAGAAEYHAATGYGETMFDSGDKKCQHCHNELYDTWKGSMHGKSWTDPIFQSKFQDFLRTHIAKIGSNPTGTLEYQEKQFKGAAQTCIKCHAPGAYYADDVSVVLTQLTVNPTTADLDAAKANNQANSIATTGAFDPTQPINVVSVSGFDDTLYQATFDIGHEANKEGINCAFCHSIETVRMMSDTDGADGGMYTLAAAMREGPVGAIQYDAGSTLHYSPEGTDIEMNAFFRLWGPEKYKDPQNTPKSLPDFDVDKAKDGRYTMHSVMLHDETNESKTHYTGGPFYGPFGVTGKSNENEDDDTNRTALISPEFDQTSANVHQFGAHGKALCLSCHQRSAGALDPASAGTAAKEPGTDNFMELCSTWNVMSDGVGNNYEDSVTSPKCQRCHMERIEGKVLHRWATPDQNWTLANNPALTAHFDPDDNDGLGDENPVAAGWLNSHAFLGASKTGGHKTSVVAKIKSGFESTLPTPTLINNTLTVTTTLKNKTAHMFPGAHPMRRVLTRLIVTDENGTMIESTSKSGVSNFATVENSVTPVADKTLHSSAESIVTVGYDAGRTIDFPGKTPDLNGSAVSGQKFDGRTLKIIGADTTVSSQEVNTTTYAIEGTVFNAAITDDSNNSTFTRIYGHETGKKYDLDGDTAKETFIVRPGFDSNTVPNDTRLLPNEEEVYTLDYDVAGASSVTVTYKVYYMQKGANGKFLTGVDGFLDQAASDAKKLLVTEVASHSETVTVAAP